MSKEPSTDTIESNKANSTVSTATIEDTKSARPRGKVSGKFLRLTMAHNGIPIFVRSDNIGAYHDQIDEQKGFQGCWLTGTSFGFSVKEYAEDLQTLIGMVEGEYSAGELAETVIALLIAGGMGAPEAQQLLSTGPREKLAAEVVKLADLLVGKWIDLMGSTNAASWHRAWLRLIEAGARLAVDLDIKHDLASPHYDPTAATVSCIDRAIARLHDREKLGQRHEELMQAGDKVLRAVGISSEEFDKEAGYGRDDHGAMQRMLGKAVEIISGLKERADNAEVDANDLRRKLLELQTVKQDAAANLKTCDELSCQLSELEDRLAFTTQARKDGEERAACLEKAADKLRARLADALRQLPEPVQRDLERVWTVRETAGGQS